MAWRLVQCCFTSTEITRTIRDGEAQDAHLDFHTAPEALMAAWSVWRGRADVVHDMARERERGGGGGGGREREWGGGMVVVVGVRWDRAAMTRLARQAAARPADDPCPPSLMDFVECAVISPVCRGDGREKGRVCVCVWGGGGGGVAAGGDPWAVDMLQRPGLGWGGEWSMVH